MRVLVIPDLHLPWVHPNALNFVRDVRDAWECDTVVYLGDIFDNHATSRWEKHPQLPGPQAEFDEAYEQVQDWYKEFGPAKVCIGNHDIRPKLRATEGSIVPQMMKTFSEAYDTPDWEWEIEHEIDGVVYTHGTTSGKNAALNMCQNRRQNIVQGHTHSFAGIQWSCSPKDRLFGANFGCLIDVSALAYEYGKSFPNKPVLACGVVVDGHPYLEAMACGPKERYHKSKS